MIWSITDIDPSSSWRELAHLLPGGSVMQTCLAFPRSVPLSNGPLTLLDSNLDSCNFVAVISIVSMTFLQRLSHYQAFARLLLHCFWARAWADGDWADWVCWICLHDSVVGWQLLWQDGRGQRFFEHTNKYTVTDMDWTLSILLLVSKIVIIQ